MKGDGDPTCFTNPADTGIPELQDWCHELTLASRQRSARLFLAHLKTFANSVMSYVAGIGDTTVADREQLRSRWESTPEDMEVLEKLEELIEKKKRDLANPGSVDYDDDDMLEFLPEGLYSMHHVSGMKDITDFTNYPMRKSAGVSLRLAKVRFHSSSGLVDY